MQQITNIVPYDPRVFLVKDEQAAKDIILTPEASMTTDERWEAETKFLATKIQFPAHSLILDIGCGIGRIAKELKHCFVIGTDISPSMRRLSSDYVGTPNFAALPPSLATELVRNGLGFDGAVAIWALQHFLHLREEIDFIFHALKPEAKLYVLNRHNRCIPVQSGWRDDDQKVYALLGEKFNLRQDFMLPASTFANGAFFACFSKPGVS